MLFLGGGNYSLRRDPVSAACLLLSICPRYPARTVDHQYHLQPLRHLYVLAAERRALLTVDVDRGLSVPVDVSVELTDGTSRHIEAPGLLPELATVRSISVLSGSAAVARSTADRDPSGSSGGCDTNGSMSDNSLVGYLSSEAQPAKDVDHHPPKESRPAYYPTSLTLNPDAAVGVAQQQMGATSSTLSSDRHHIRQGGAQGEPSLRQSAVQSRRQTSVQVPPLFVKAIPHCPRAAYGMGASGASKATGTGHNILNGLSGRWPLPDAAAAAAATGADEGLFSVMAARLRDLGNFAQAQFGPVFALQQQAAAGGADGLALLLSEVDLSAGTGACGGAGLLAGSRNARLVALADLLRPQTRTRIKGRMPVNNTKDEENKDKLAAQMVDCPAFLDIILNALRQ